MTAKLLVHRRDTYTNSKAPIFATKAGAELDPHNVRRTILRPAADALGHYELVDTYLHLLDEGVGEPLEIDVEQ